MMFGKINKTYQLCRRLLMKLIGLI